MTDKDRGPAYAAEFALRKVLDLSEQNDTWNYDFHGHKMQLPQERKFADLASIAAYCEKVLALSSVRERWPNAVLPKFVESRKISQAHYSSLGHEIAIPTVRRDRWALRELVVLHELAHSLVPMNDHGPEWRGAYLFLLHEATGPELALILSQYFYEECGAPHVMPKVRGLQSC